GLRVQSALGNITMPVKSVLAEQLKPGYDVVLFTCKAYDLDSATDAIAPAMTGSCAVVPMLNGMAHYQRPDARFGHANIMGGTCFIDSALNKDGLIVHGQSLQRLVFGERGGLKEPSPRARAFADALGKSKIEYELTASIELVLWEKLMFLAALASITCLFRG